MADPQRISLVPAVVEPAQRRRRRVADTLGLQGVVCHWPEGGDLGMDLGATRNLDLMRILNEALNAAILHKGAEKVAVQIEAREDAIHLEIRNDGVGLDPKSLDATPGFRSIRAWAKRLGALLDVQSEPGCGACIRVITPLRLDPA